MSELDLGPSVLQPKPDLTASFEALHKVSQALGWPCSIEPHSYPSAWLSLQKHGYAIACYITRCI